MGAGTAATKFTPRCVWIPSTVPESTPPPYPVSCTATPSRENKMDPQIVCWYNWNRGKAEKFKQKSIHSKEAEDQETKRRSSQHKRGKSNDTRERRGRGGEGRQEQSEEKPNTPSFWPVLS